MNLEEIKKKIIDSGIYEEHFSLYKEKVGFFNILKSTDYDDLYEVFYLDDRGEKYYKQTIHGIDYAIDYLIEIIKQNE